MDDRSRRANGGDIPENVVSVGLVMLISFTSGIVFVSTVAFVVLSSISSTFRFVGVFFGDMILLMLMLMLILMEDMDDIVIDVIVVDVFGVVVVMDAVMVCFHQP